MKEKSYILKVLPVFIISPLLALPILIRDIKKGKYYAFSYLAVFMSLMAYLWIPSGDVYRFYEEFEVIKNSTFAEVIELSLFDYVANILMYLLSKTGLNFEWYRLLQCYICYSMVFAIIRDIYKNTCFQNDNNNRFMIFVTFFGLLQFSMLLSGARFPFSVIMMIYGIYGLFYKKQNLCFIWVILAGLCHYSFWPVVAMSVFCKLYNPVFEKRTVVILIVVFYLASSVLLLLFIDYMNFGDAMMDQLDNYTTGYFADGELKDRSFKFLILRQVTRLPFYLSIYLGMTRLKDFSRCQLFVCLLLFSILLINMNTAFGRYSLLTEFSILPFFLLNIDNSFNPKHLKMFYYLAIIVFSVSVYSCKRELTVGKQYLIVAPVPYILSQNYTDSWISNHINPDGSIVGQD